MQSAEQLKRYQTGMRRHPTHHEALFMKRLEKAGIPYKHQVIIGFYIADIVLPTKLLVIEIDGKHHKRQKEYDQRRDEFMRRVGFEIVRIPDSKVLLYDLEELKARPDHTIEEFGKLCWRGVSLKGSLLCQQRKDAERREIEEATSPLF